MKRQGARLTISGALGRQSSLEPLQMSTETNSAVLSKAEREIKILKGENQRLRRELEDVRSLYTQLIQENTHERFDEHRVTLLKSQVIQLERQVLLMSEALSSRTETLLEVENSLTWLADKCRNYITKEVKGPEVNVPRSDLTLMVETAESARIKLYKQLENRTTEKLSRQLLFYNEFIHQSRQNDVTLLDIASGSLEHLNLKQVAKLESKLCTLYRELISLHSQLEQDQQVSQVMSPCMWTSSHVTLAARERLMTQILKSCAIMKDCTSDLLDVSLLFPAAPWPPLKNSALKEVTPECVLKCLPVIAKSRSSEGQKVIQALVKAYNYKVYMLNTQVQSLRKEAKYHQKVYNLQLKYTESLFQAIREGYREFEESTSEAIVKPLKDILEAYVDLNQTASETALKVFLKKFKDRASQFSDIAETLAVKEDESEGSKVLSSYGEEFFKSLEKIVHEHQVKRDREADHYEDIRCEQERLDQELREILNEQESRLQDSLLKSSAREDSLIDDSGEIDSKNKVYTRSNTETESLESDKLIGDQKKERQSRSSADGRKSDIDSGRKTKRNDKSKIKRPEWNNDFAGDFSKLSLDDSVEVGYKAGCKIPTSDFRDGEIVKTDPSLGVSVEDTNTETAELKTSDEQISKPPRTKKKLGYTPNTFVPNRTLQLRRSGSLSKLSDSKPDYQSGRLREQSETAANSIDDQPQGEAVRQPSGKSAHTRSGKSAHTRSLSRDRAAAKLPPKKPAFK